MKDDLAALTSRLVAIDSINPSLAPGAPGERAIAAFVADRLQKSGARVGIVPAVAADDRPSVLGILPGTGGGRSLLLYAHLDTVGAAGMGLPHQPVIDGDRLLGRGALDMKGSLAVILSVVESCARSRLAGDLVIAAVADEEGSSLGMEAVLRRMAEIGCRPAAAIVTEPTDLKLCVAHRGFAWATITTHGRASHTALPGEGIDAIARMGRVLVALEDLDRSLHSHPAHLLIGHGSVLASLIRGGSELFTTPAECRIDLVRRTLPGQTAADVTDEIERLLSKLRARDPKFAATFELKLYRAPLEIPAASPIAAVLASSAERTLGSRPATFGAPYWTDAGLLAEAGIPTAIFGPSGEGLHSDVEWVSLSSLESLADILTDTTKTFCSPRLSR
jgi:acetylornithine deacetylase